MGIKVLRRCPPPVDAGEAADSPTTTVKVSHLIASLEFIQGWAAEIAEHLKNIEGDPVVSKKKE